MTVSDQVAAHSEQINTLRAKFGLRGIDVYECADGTSNEPVFVVDLNPDQTEGYADRYFEAMFGLQRIFENPVDMWEKHMFEQDSSRARFRLVPIVLKHAA